MGYFAIDFGAVDTDFVKWRDKTRILHRDTRFSKSPGYIFAAAAYIEQKQLMSKANISFMRGRKNATAKGAPQYELDDAFTTFDGIKNTGKR